MLDKDFEMFLAANERRIHYQIHRLGVSGDWYAEFYAEGVVALWRAYREHEVVKGNLGTFVNYRIRFRLIDLMRKKMREQQTDELVVTAKREEQHDGNLHRASGLHVLDVRGVELVDDTFWKVVRERLSEKQWKWVYYFIICDLSVKEIMELEEVSADAVKGWGRQVRSKLREEDVRVLLEELM